MSTLVDATVPSTPGRSDRPWLRDAGRRVARLARSRTGLALLVLMALGLAAALWLVWPYARALGDIRAGIEHQPSRLWGAPETVAVGDPLTPAALAKRLDALGFRAVDAAEPPPRSYRVADGVLALHLPERITPQGRRGRERVEIHFRDGVVATIRGDTIRGATIRGDTARETAGEPREESLFLGAPLLASYYGEEVREIIPVRVDDLPEHVIAAILAAEDRNFYFHPGVSPVGIARAAIVNAKEGEVKQGGSTITQQLVKNVFLTHERSLLRKAREAVLSLVVEGMHPKKAILQAYLNRIYLGTGHGLNFYGIGAAARHYFGVDARDLTVGQAATLAGLIRSPGSYTPLRHPEAARERRDQVLAAMAENGFLEPAELDAARAEPIVAAGVDLGARRAPYFADAVAEETRSRFALRALGDRGYQIFTTLRPAEQEAAERAVEETLTRLPARARLEGALVTVDPRDGRVLAWVGGRDYDESQFDRVRLARRQAGSAFKPVVLAAALEAGYSPASRLEDAPLALETGGRTWRPANADGRFRGPVTVRRTIEESLNVPTVRLAQAVGLEEVIAMARRLGIESPLEAVPSIALGAFEVSPLELATVYATFANGGKKPTVHAVAAVRDAAGDAIGDTEPPPPEPVLDPRVAYQIGSILRGAVTSGTARGARAYRVAGDVAAKTGTSNEARDSWFAAYRPDRVTVVWVGHDEPRPTPLSGARAALPIWGAYAGRAYPAAVPDDPPPAGIRMNRVCYDSGQVPRKACPRPIEEAFVDGQGPDALCDLHRPGVRPEKPPEKEKKPVRWLKRKLKKVFG